MVETISVQQVLDVVGGFDDSGGASLGLVAWELSVDERHVADAWRQAQADGFIEPAGRSPLGDEQLWRLTVSGWGARDQSLPIDQEDGRPRP